MKITKLAYKRAASNTPKVIKTTKGSQGTVKTIATSKPNTKPFTFGNLKPIKAKAKAKNFIAGAIKHPGALHREMGVKAGQKIPAGRLAAAAKKPGVLGRRARFAETLKGMH